MLEARAVESSQLEAYCAVCMGTLSVWPSMRRPPAGSAAARARSVGMEEGRRSAEPESKKPPSCRETTRPSGVGVTEMSAALRVPAVVCFFDDLLDFFADFCFFFLLGGAG